jgi:hypothetical protein
VSAILKQGEMIATMPNHRPNRWQFSLAGLMVFVAIAAFVCQLAGYVGYALLLGLFPIVWVFYSIYRLIDTMIKTGNRNSSSKSPTATYNEPKIGI